MVVTGTTLPDGLCGEASVDPLDIGVCVGSSLALRYG
jgi:hypothetical protein